MAASEPYSWRQEDFCDFVERLELPSGGPFRLEPFQRLIIRELFAPGRVELAVLLPKGNAKSTLLAAAAVFHILVTKNAEVFVGAADREQASTIFRFAQHFVESEPELSRLLLVRPSTKEIRSRRDAGFIRVLASDTSAAGGRRHSFNPTLALVDELHAHPNDALYVALRSAAFKRDGVVVVITTAGHDQESTLGKLRRGMLALDQEGGSVDEGLTVDADGTPRSSPDGRLTIARSASDRTAFLEWASRAEDDLSDPDVVALANPASFVTVESLRDALEAPGITPWAFARYRANRWTAGFESWLPAGAWDALADPSLSIPPEGEIVAGLDMGRYSDSTALVWLWDRGDKPPVVRARIWASGGEDAPIEYAPVMDAIRALDRDHELRAVAFDPRYFDQAAEELQHEGLPMVKFDQSNARMGPASMGLRKAILEGELVHDGDRRLAAHVTAGVVKDIGPDAWRLVKAKRRGPPIDGVIALAMAHRLLTQNTDARPVMPFIEVFG